MYFVHWNLNTTKVQLVYNYPLNLLINNILSETFNYGLPGGTGFSLMYNLILICYEYVSSSGLFSGSRRFVAI